MRESVTSLLPAQRTLCLPPTRPQQRTADRRAAASLRSWPCRSIVGQTIGDASHDARCPDDLYCLAVLVLVRPADLEPHFPTELTKLTSNFGAFRDCVASVVTHAADSLRANSLHASRILQAAVVVVALCHLLRFRLMALRARASSAGARLELESRRGRAAASVPMRLAAFCAGGMARGARPCGACVRRRSGALEVRSGALEV